MKQLFTYDSLEKLFDKDIARLKAFREIPVDLLPLKLDASTWSAGEIFQHLVKFNSLYLQFIDRGIQQQKTITNNHPAFNPRFFVNLLIKFMRPPYKIKIGTIAPMHPESSDNDDYKQSLEELIEINYQLIDRINTMRERNLDLNSTKEKNRVLKFSMRLVEFLLMFNAHQQRHFLQAEQTLLKLSGQKY